MEFLAYSTYRGLTTLARPWVSRLLQRRMRAGKEDQVRLPERMGVAGRARPEGRLIWVHAASVGESLSLLALIKRIISSYPGVFVLVTTGTVTSARLMAERLPSQAFHQFMPVDVPLYVGRFMDYWRPDMVLWAESELWPNFLFEIERRKIPAVLVNARMSGRSFSRWSEWPRLSRFILGKFTLCLAQNELEAGRYRALGAPVVAAPGNLKYAAAPLPVDQAALDAFKVALGTRPVWLFSSTHPGEEEIAGRAQLKLRADIPGLLTVIVPRHPKRGAEIAQGLRTLGLAVCRRAEGGLPAPSDDVYVADTLGELGLFYRAIALCVMGGSFVSHGGHNPIEPGQLGCMIFYGPHMHNFETICHDFESAGAASRLADARELEEKLWLFLGRSAPDTAMAEKARDLTARSSAVVEDIFLALGPLLEKAL